MRTIIWTAFKNAKFNSEYTCLLIAKNRRILNRYNIIILLCSTTGIFGWKIWNDYPIIVCIAVAIISLLKLIENHLIPTEKAIQKFDKVSDFYSGMFIKLERIWFDLEHREISASEALTQYHEIAEKEREINMIVNEIHKREDKKAKEKATSISDNYFHQAYNTSL